MPDAPQSGPGREWSNVQRILVIRLDNIGDVVLLSPALRTLRTALPAAHITLMASPGGGQAAVLLPWVDEVMTVRASWQEIGGPKPPDPAYEMALVERVRQGAFDAAIIFTSFAQSPYPPAYVCYLAGVPVRLGQSKEFGGLLLSQWVKPRADDCHQAERNLYLLEAAGFPSAGRDLEIRIPTEAQIAGDRLLAAAGINPARPFVAMAPGASAQARRYDPARYAEVARTLAGRMGLPVALLGTAREADLLASIAASAWGRPVASLAGRTALPEMAAVLNRSALVIANNSSSLHLADALGRPMVILFSGTEIESQWRPRRAPARLLRWPTDCSPCYAFKCPYHLECLDITPETVVNAALELLATQSVASLGGESHADSDMAHSR
jgi:ADP-heptose:LPS heptosyltransferase